MADKGKRTVGYKDMREYIELLDKNGQVKHVTAPVDLKFELGAICARSLDLQGPALIFDTIKGYPGQSFATNLMSTLEQVALIFNCEPNETAISDAVYHGMNNRIASEVVESAPVKDVIITGDDIDITKFPTPIWHELDGGAYIATTGGVITKHPDTGVHNMGSYRMMIADKKTLTLTAGGASAPGAKPTEGGGYGGKGDVKGGAHILMHEQRGERAPVVLALGMDPLLVLASGTAVPADSEGMSEYEAAGGWRGEPTVLVKCETSDLLVPAYAEMIVEGYATPRRVHEGPHGESTGFYGENPSAFEIEITCITHRRDPIQYGLICQQIEDYPRTLLRSGSVKSVLVNKAGLANVKEVRFPEVGRNGMLVIAADIQDRDEPRKIMEGAWDQLQYRWVIVVDEDCDVDNWLDILWRVCSAVDVERDVVAGPKKVIRGRGGVMDFDPPDNGLGIDATMKFKETPEFPPVNKVSRNLMDDIKARWSEFMS